MKTKEQKRLEARDRFRAQFAKEKEHWEAGQPGGFLYQLAAESRGLIAAEDLKKQADETFLKFRVHAEVDEFGDPISLAQVFEMKSRTYTGFRGSSNTEVYPSRFAAGHLEYGPCNNFT